MMPRTGGRRAVGPMVCGLLVIGCGDGAAPPTEERTGAIEVVDARGRALRFEAPVERIVSLVPSATEVLVAIGAADRLVARTRFDSDPRVAELPAVGGAVDPNLEVIVELDPDLVIAWGPGASGSAVQRLERWGIPVYTTGARKVDDVFEEIAELGTVTGRTPSAEALLDSLTRGLDAVRRRSATSDEVSVLYVLWPRPLRTTGPGTFVAELIQAAGGRVLFHDLSEPWPLVSLEEVLVRDPSAILVPSDVDGPFRDAWDDPDSPWRTLSAVRDNRVHVVNGDLLNRPGPRLLEAARTVERLLRAPSWAAEPLGTTGTR